MENAAIYLEYMAQWDRRIEGEIVPSDNRNETILLNRVPIGVVAAITAWNYPLDLFIRKAAPALITGNTMVVKPTEVTPLACIRALQLISENDLPAGRRPQSRHRRRRGRRGTLLASAGQHDHDDRSSRHRQEDHGGGGRQISRAFRWSLAAARPAIVWKDADLDLAADALAFSSFENTGQVCTSSERILVHQDVHDAFVERLVERANRLKLGAPRDDTDLGPLVNRHSISQGDAKRSIWPRRKAAQLACGGYGLPSLPGKGYWVRPTVITGVTPDMSLVNNEIFGPIAPVIRIADYDEAIRLANATRYGLTAFVFSNDYRLIMRAQNELRFGELYINRGMGEALQGFHNGHQESGIGGEDGKHGVLKYTQIRAVYHRYG